jgi:hypothetical protein
VNEIDETAEDALMYALDALQEVDELLGRVYRLEKVVELLLEGHPAGARTALGLDARQYRFKPGA